MAEQGTTSRALIHQMLNTIKKAEIENAKTMKFDDKTMVRRITDYIIKMAKSEVSGAESENDEVMEGERIV